MPPDGGAGIPVNHPLRRQLMNADQVNANGALLTGPMKEKWEPL